MRTTLTLEADVARALKAAVRRRKVSFKEAVNETMRAGLGLNASRGPRSPFVVRPHRGGLKPGIDPRKLGRLADELEDESTMASLRRR